MRALPRPAAPDPLAWRDYAAHVGEPEREDARLFPDFLVVSPARSATSWLFASLRNHPDLHLPPSKELRYFDRDWRTFGVGGYCRAFTGGHGRIKGEVSPSYSLLPSVAIGHIARLKPGLKIVMIVRDPVERAWSHLKHMYNFREANFDGCTERFDQLGLPQLIANVVHDYSLSSGDYAAIARRWLRHFPRAQFHVLLVEGGRSTRQEQLAALCRFLGVNDGADVMAGERVNTGRPERLPGALRPWLQVAYERRWAEFKALIGETAREAGPSMEPSLVRLDLPHPPAPQALKIEFAGGVFAALGAQSPFLGELLEDVGCASPDGYGALAAAGWSREDRRLAKQLDHLATCVRPLNAVLRFGMRPLIWRSGPGAR